MPRDGEVSGITVDQLRSLVSRVERLDEDAEAINADRAEVFKEAKGEGWNVKAIKAVLAERRARRKNPTEFAALRSEIDIYRAQLGMEDATRGHGHEAA
jgi:uncharacterized protein (UPF0335 family)